MSVTIPFSGTNYSIPSQAERNWATQINTFYQALAANALPRNGGSFTLANDLDLGATASVYMKSLISKTASASATGFLKLAATDSIGWRNNAGTGDVLLGIDASNNLQFNGVVLSTAASTVTLAGTQTLTNKTLSTGTVISAGKITTAVNEVDATDNTKQLAVSLSGAVTATTTTLVMSQTANRSITLPDATDTLVGKATVDTLTNKTLTSPVLNTPTTSGEIIANYEDFTQVATPTTPGTGVTRVYSKTDGKLYQKTSAGVESQLGGGGLSGVLATANVTTAVNGTMYECTSTGGFTITLPTIPSGGSVIGIMDTAGTCSATNFIRITPATGQSLDLLAVNDSYLMDYSNANVIAYAAAGATSWKLQKQATTMVQGGLVPANVSGTLTQTNAVGEALGTTRSGIGGSTASDRAVTNFNNSVTSLVSRTLNKGTYLIGAGATTANTSAGARNVAYWLAIGGTQVSNTYTLFVGASGVLVSVAVPMMVITISTDATVVDLRGQWNATGTSNTDSQELMIVRI